MDQIWSIGECRGKEIVPMLGMNDEADSLLQRPSNETTSQLPSIPNACRRNGFGILVVVLLTSLNLTNTILGYSLQKKEHMDPLFLIYFNVCWDVIGLVIAATLQQQSYYIGLDKLVRQTTSLSKTIIK